MTSRRSWTPHLSEWSRMELEYMAEHIEEGTAAIALALGRTTRETSYIRGRMLSPSQDDPWCREDDELIASTANLTEGQVAVLLNRSISSVSNRRKVVGNALGISFGEGGMAKSPYAVGARPLLAKTCTKCGLLLPSDWFIYSNTKNGRGGWRSDCRKCGATQSASWKARNGNGKVDRERHAGSSRRARRVLEEFTQAKAYRGGQPWTGPDHEVLRDPDLTLLEKALRLGRTYNAVAHACSRHGYRSHVGLGDAEKDIWRIENPNAPQAAA